MPEKPTVEVPVVKPTMIEVSSDPRGDATIQFETVAMLTFSWYCR